MLNSYNNFKDNMYSEYSISYRDLIRSLYGILFLTLFLVWFLVQPSIIFSGLTIRNNTFSYMIVEIDLSSLRISSSSNIIVTILNDSSEVELPFTIKPMGIDTIRYVSFILVSLIIAYILKHVRDKN